MALGYFEPTAFSPLDHDTQPNVVVVVVQGDESQRSLRMSPSLLSHA